jgi:exonuclease III
MSIFNISHINIGCWNVQGMAEYKMHDNTVLNYIDRHDLAIFVESWLNETIYYNDNYTYCLLAKKSNRGRSKGGIVITMKKDIRKGVKIVEVFESNIVILKLDRAHFNLLKDLFIYAIYIPPIDSLNRNCDKFYMWEILDDYISKYSGLGDTLIIGDFNSRIGSLQDILEPNPVWDDKNNFNFVDSRNLNINPRVSRDSVTNQYGRKLIDLCKHDNLLILNGRTLGDLQGEFTSFHYNGSSVIDYCIVNINLQPNILYCKVSEATHLSDHAQLSVRITSRYSLQTNEKQIDNDINFAMGYVWDECQYKDVLKTKKIISMAESINSVNIYSNNTEGVNKLCTDITSVLTEAANLALVRRKRFKNKKVKSKPTKWYTKNLYQLKCNVLHTTKLLRKFPKDSVIRGNYIRNKKTYKQACKQAKRRYIRNFAEQLDRLDMTNPTEFWKLFNSLKTQCEDDNNLPSLDEFVQVYNKSNVQNVYNENFHRKVENYLKYVKHDKYVESLDNPILKDELYKAIKKVKDGKAYGNDLVTYEMLKSAVYLIENPVLRLFNMCMNSGVYPDNWCHGHIKPVYKSGDKCNANNYRPITISSCFGKLFSSIINNRILSYLNNNSLMSNVQIGGVKGHRTTDHLLMLKGITELYKKKGKHVYACFVDFKSAFDSVWHLGLLYKMRKYGLSCKIINLLTSMYNKLNTCVKIGPNISKNFECNIGTRQGCNLSSTLFNMYVDDLSKMFNDTRCDPVNFEGTKLGCLLYADDVLILSSSAKGLQSSLNKLNNYCKKWRLTVNTVKTKTMVFNSRKSNHVFTLGNYVLDNTDRICYLGFIITPSFKIKSVIKFLYDKANNAIFKLKSNLKYLSNLSVNTYLKIFDSVIKPIALYGAEVWGAYMHKTQNNEINLNYVLEDVKSMVEKLHIRTCKQILQVNKHASNYAVRFELGRVPLAVNIICKVLNYYINIENQHGNSICKIALNLHMSNNNSWYHFVKSVVHRLGLNLQLITKNSLKNKGLVFQKLKDLCKNIYRGKILECNKLKLYSKIKFNLEREKYLSCLNPALRKAATELRISSHKLAIEVGRHNNVAAEARICKYCNQKVGDEEHHIMYCYNPVLTNLRNNFIQNILNVNSHLKLLNRQNLFLYVISLNDTNIVQPTLQYFCEALNVQN